jgi:NADPH-dependent glutamate synthase beta subunit-like oxidoreductase
VTVFEKESRPGGMLTNGIPNFRLEKDTLNAEIDVLKQMGVEFKCGVDVGKDVTIPELREQGYKAFYSGMCVSFDMHCRPVCPVRQGYVLLQGPYCPC